MNYILDLKKLIIEHYNNGRIDQRGKIAIDGVSRICQ